MTGILAVRFDVLERDEGEAFCVGVITYDSGTVTQTPINTYTELEQKVVGAGLTMDDLKISTATRSWLRDQDGGAATRKRVQMVLVTDQPNEAYGGIQLPLAMLHGVAEAVRSGKIPLTFNHDARYVTDVQYLGVGVRERPDGFHEVWAEAEIPAADWERFDQQRVELGAPGGISITFGTPLATYDGPTQSALQLAIAADAHHFSDDEIQAAGQKLAEVGHVECERMYQFSIVPPAAVVITYLLNGAAQIPPGVLANYVWESVKGFFRSDREPTSVTLNLEETPGERILTAVIPATTDAEVAKKALETFESVANRSGVYEYDDSDKSWTVVRPPT